MGDNIQLNPLKFDMQFDAQARSNKNQEVVVKF